MILFSKMNKKGFTLMELLVTVILVAVLASYSVYYYNNTMEEGKLNAAKGKLAALGGAVERFKAENSINIACGTSVAITSSNMGGACNANANSTNANRFLDVFTCAYAERSLGLDENFTFYFACASTECDDENAPNEYVAVLKKSGSTICAYFNPVKDKVEVKGL